LERFNSINKDLVKKFPQDRSKTKQLLEEAKRKVEELIEK
jgi:ABC-type Zn uptake system ZnuABC Zn-binding protein ZnuA